ncbi:MAG: helix-turn-helix domain-containing protein [Pseudomonadota bacterium]
MAEEKKLFWREACALLGCGRTKFYDLVNNGSLPSSRTVSKQVYVTEKDCRALLKAMNRDWEDCHEI